MGLDIGPKTIELFSKEISKARTIVWNGPLGMFEKPAFAQGTLAIARAVAAATSKGATSIIGGGDSVAAAEQSGVARQISHISTGGGASLEFLAGEKLPGVEALTDKHETSPRRSNRTTPGESLAPPGHRRQLEDVQDAGGNARVFRGFQAAGFCLAALRHRRRAAIHGHWQPPSEAARGSAIAIAAPESALGARRRVHRRNFRRHDCGSGRHKP